MLQMIKQQQYANQAGLMGQIGMGLSSMNLGETRIHKDKLLGVLRANAEAHKKSFTEAMADYWEALKKYHTKGLETATNKTGPVTDPCPMMPEDHSFEYEKVIKMLEMTVDEVLTLSDQQFQTLVMDHWIWKDNFAINSMMLKAYRG